MNLNELKIVEKTVHDIYASWHPCALGTPKNPLLKEDRARGLRKGQLCDGCNAMIAAHMKDIAIEAGVISAKGKRFNEYSEYLEKKYPTRAHD